MSTTEVRPLRRDDFAEIMRLEETIFAGRGEAVLGAYYVRLCCEFFPDSCFVAIARGRVVGYLLAFVRGDEAYCTTLAVVPELQGTRTVLRLLQAFTRKVLGQVERCWFTVDPENEAARALHATLGAEPVAVRDDFYGPGDRRLLASIDRATVWRLRRRYERLGLIEPTPPRLRAISAALEATL